MFEDAYDHGAIFSDVINSPIATKGKNYSIPALSLDLEDGVFTGVPTDVAGTAGRGGSAALFKNRAGDISQIGDGGDGGDGGAGLIIISRGLSFGPSADIDVSGDDGNIGEEVSQFIDYGADEHGDIERTYYWWSGSGAGGSPGAVIALIDGNDTPPALSNYVTANLGNSPLSNGNYQIPAGGKKFALTYDESYKIFSWNQGYAQTSMVKACTSVQYVPADQTVQEETDQLHQLDPPDSVTATVYTGEAVTITSAGNRMQPVQIAWSQNTDPDCIGYEVRAKRTADSNYRTVILTRSSSEVRGHYNQQQADEYSIQVRCISKSEQHSDWASITYTAAVTNDTITTIGAFVQAPFPVRYVPNRITCALDNSTGNNGFYEIARQRITAPYNSFSFDGIVSIGSSGGRYHEQSRVNLSFIVTSPAIQIAKVAFEYSGFDCSSRLRLTYEDNGDGTYTVHVYAFLTSWASLIMSGDWTINSDLSQGWITSYFPVAEGTTDAVVGTAVTATANYEDGATVGGQLGSNLTDESGAVASDLHVLNANQSWGDVEGQRYTHSPVIGTTRHLMFKSENPHLYSSPLNTWVELVAVQLPRYGNILVMFRTEFGVYEGRTDTVVNWEWTINGLTQSSVTYTYTPEQFYNISFVANNISAGDVIRISAKIDETQGLPAPTNLPTFDYIEVYSDVTFGIMEI